MELNQITRRIIAAAIRVHRELGPGLLESAYETCLEYELRQDDLEVARQYPVPLLYHGIAMDCGYRIDLLVERRVVVEVKAVVRLEPIFAAQVLTYLRLCGAEAGLLMNFNQELLHTGIKRLIRNQPGQPLRPLRPLW